MCQVAFFCFQNFGGTLTDLVDGQKVAPRAAAKLRAA
jgi:hypothetical protein